MIPKRFVLLLVAIVVCSCSSTMRSEIKPGFDDLSGIYRYTGLTGYSAAEFPNPLIDFYEIAEPSDVTIVQTETAIQATYLTEQGEAITNEVSLTNQGESASVWQNSVLTTNNRVPIVGAPILPLPAKHYRGTRILRGEDGNLYVIGTFKEKGFLFTDYWENELMLERMD